MSKKRMVTDAPTATVAKVDLRPYRGQYVAMLESKVLAHGENAAVVYAEARTLLPQEISPEAIVMVQVPAAGLWIV